ncbi:hypothetical protein ACFONC_07910 [Luteimonas soli]|uniref:Uncharacterized protein n=1 Tax=Luteimonas soli TaxID=1648966 RepID=A0ABV7XJY2_9GAMM
MNRGWVEDVERLHQEGLIDGDDQNTLIRHVEDQRRSLQEELALIVPEYKERITRDGQSSADEWLAAKARELGERDGDKTRRVVDSLSTVENQSS